MLSPSSAARSVSSGEEVAVKKVTKVFEKTLLAKRALREIKLLRHFNGHENITSILDMEIDDPANFDEIYLVQELMEADLHQIIRSQQALTDAHFQYFIYQLCRGLKYIHSANVIHRDLKPGSSYCPLLASNRLIIGNLLVNADCELKICDFGLARGLSVELEAGGVMTEYVATRWYRAPEIMLSNQSYTKASKLRCGSPLTLTFAVDIWSVGCIFAEMMGGRPLFKGRDCNRLATPNLISTLPDIDQLKQILATLGTPDEETLQRIGSERQAQEYIRSLPRMEKVPFHQVYPRATPAAIDLLASMLELDPTKRITAEAALAHPYLAAYHDAEDEPTHPHRFDFSFESVESMEAMREMIIREVEAFKAHVSVDQHA
ncbi:mitogen activated protein kinase [Massospora cicadina]|nr:mitogen activated protein kinase [Massospora cicadina]